MDKNIFVDSYSDAWSNIKTHRLWYNIEKLLTENNGLRSIEKGHFSVSLPFSSESESYTREEILRHILNPMLVKLVLNIRKFIHKNHIKGLKIITLPSKNPSIEYSPDSSIDVEVKSEEIPFRITSFCNIFIYDNSYNGEYVKVHLDKAIAIDMAFEFFG